MYAGRETALRVEIVQDVAVVRLVGEHDLSTVPELTPTLRSLIDEGYSLVVDVRHTEFVDLSVIRALLEADDTLRAQDRRLVLRGGTAPSVNRLLDIIRADTWFLHSADAEHAIALAHASRPTELDAT